MTLDPVTLIRSLAPLAAAGALAYALYLGFGALLAGMQSGASKALAGYYAQPENPNSGQSGPPMGSREYRIRLAYEAYGIPVAGWEELAVTLTIGVLSVLVAGAIWIAGLPPVLMLAAVFIVYTMVSAFVEGRWDVQRLDLEKEIPSMLTRLSSLIKANPNLIETLDNVAEGLDPKKPLKPWLKRLANRLQAAGARGLHEMQQEAERISPSLLLAVVEIGRMWETGGKGYTDALRMASDNMASLMETRSQANAVALGAWGTARTILIALSITLGTVMLNPISKPAFQMPAIQLLLIGAVVWGGIGFWRIRDMIAEVTD